MGVKPGTLPGLPHLSMQMGYIHVGSAISCVWVAFFKPEGGERGTKSEGAGEHSSTEICGASLLCEPPLPLFHFPFFLTLFLSFSTPHDLPPTCKHSECLTG